MLYCNNCGAKIPGGAMYCPKCGTAVQIQKMSAEVAVPAGAPMLTLAFWSDRFVAWLIDVVIIGVISFVLGLFSWWTSLTLFPVWSWWIPFFNVGGPSGLLLFLYWTLMEGAYGQSFGKMVMRIKVTQLDGSRAGIGYAALESVGKAYLLPLDLILGWALHPKKRQRIFNYISKTVVTKIT
jgi:uncharacterized RDD family membrane protein YckC